MRALFVLTPAESKRFIAKAVAALPYVQKAREEGEIVISHGTTTGRIVEELLGECPNRDKFISGQIINRILCVTQAEEKPPIIVVRRGKVVLPELTMEEVLKNFDDTSVFIKGANAVDPEGNAGVYVAHHAGGTIGYAHSILSARGCHLIVPVGLEKLVPSVRKAAEHLGQATLDYAAGIKIGMIPIMNATVVTEIETFRILFGLEAIHAGGGGIDGSEGSVTLVVEGEKKDIEPAIKLIEGIKGEPEVRSVKSLCLNCLPTAASTLKSPEEQFAEIEKKHCIFRGKREEELPLYLQQRGTRG